MGIPISIADLDTFHTLPTTKFSPKAKTQTTLMQFAWFDLLMVL